MELNASSRRTILFANTINLLIGLYFVLLAISALITLRWYHQITYEVRQTDMRTFSTTSYAAFVILIMEGLLLIIIFAFSLIGFRSRVYYSTNTVDNCGDNNTKVIVLEDRHIPDGDRSCVGCSDDQEDQGRVSASNRRYGSPTLVMRDSSFPQHSSFQIYCWSFTHVLASSGLIVILTIWLANTGELVRQTISQQLEYSYARYQFSNRSNHFSIMIDGMQDLNSCCGLFHYSDFPHRSSLISGLSYGNYPGSCCEKNVFGSNARVICKPEDIIRVRQTVSVLVAYGILSYVLVK